jgi:hypothetical protein
MSADINVGAITEALNSKVDLVNGVPQDAVDYVVAMQRPTADNNYTWYRKYKSGWVEQGGVQEMSGGENTVSLLVPMANDQYLINIRQRATKNASNTESPNKNTVGNFAAVINSMTTSSFVARGSTELNVYCFYWQVSGMAA